MLRNLKAEMVRANINITDIAEFLGVRYGTANDKINGKYRFYYDEAISIKNEFFEDLEIEYLFEKAEEEVHC